MGGFMSKQPTGLSPTEQRVQNMLSLDANKALGLAKEVDIATQQVQKQSGTIYFLTLLAKVLAGLLVTVIIWDWLAIRFGFRTLWWPSPPTDDSTDGDSAKKKVKGGTSPSKKVTSKPLLKSLADTITGGGGDLLSAIHDATTSVTIPGSSVPLSGESNGSYSLQWWMYIQDWNYGFGKEKDVIVRSDPTNTSVVNPHVTLHPTENTLKVTVSVFTDNEAGVGVKAEPTPSGSGQTDLDVFTCEVANIPLQSWFSVGLTVFSRNLDIYIDGKLVKSCLLTGVPKPAVGDVILTPNGGYSGYMCGFSTLPRMLTPGDALNFFAEGTPCSSQTPSPGTGMSGLTGYSVKIGVYNPVGKEVQEYSF